jgi:hypothetical protein
VVCGILAISIFMNVCVTDCGCRDFSFPSISIENISRIIYVYGHEFLRSQRCFVVVVIVFCHSTITPATFTFLMRLFLSNEPFFKTLFALLLVILV